MEQNVYSRYSEIGETHWWFKSRRIIFDGLLGTLKLSEKSKILDFGCGVGSNLKILEKYGSVDAFEPNQLAQKYIKKYQKVNLVMKQYFHSQKFLYFLNFLDIEAMMFQ